MHPLTIDRCNAGIDIFAISMAVGTGTNSSAPYHPEVCHLFEHLILSSSESVKQLSHSGCIVGGSVHSGIVEFRISGDYRYFLDALNCFRELLQGNLERKWFSFERSAVLAEMSGESGDASAFAEYRRSLLHGRECCKGLQLAARIESIQFKDLLRFRETVWKQCPIAIAAADHAHDVECKAFFSRLEGTRSIRAVECNYEVRHKSPGKVQIKSDDPDRLIVYSMCPWNTKSVDTICAAEILETYLAHGRLSLFWREFRERQPVVYEYGAMTSATCAGLLLETFAVISSQVRCDNHGLIDLFRDEIETQSIDSSLFYFQSAKRQAATLLKLRKAAARDCATRLSHLRLLGFETIFGMDDLVQRTCNMEFAQWRRIISPLLESSSVYTYCEQYEKRLSFIDKVRAVFRKDLAAASLPTTHGDAHSSSDRENSSASP